VAATVSAIVSTAMPRSLATSAAVSLVRDNALETIRSKWIGRSASATVLACCRPRSVSGLSIRPVNTPFALPSLSPWRTK